MSEPGKPVGAIFDAAMELPPERRAAYVQEACAGDDSLRLRVEALLRAHESAGTFMDNPAVHADPQTAVVRPTEQIGDRIGRYKLLQQIGEGGCGVVYMARQEEPVRRRVALKVIKLGMDTKNVIARFEAERQALALMDHPNIAKVLDAGATEVGRPYFVMELVRGIKITDYYDQNELSTRERLDLFIQVCHAIQHAHQKGVIHRDIKPSNILVTVNDGLAVPKVIDFGIAKATQGKLTDQTVFTAFEQFIGTPAYMSPEQAEMTSLDIDTRSDIYSLGVLLYELLTGRTPFDAKKLLQAGLDEIRRKIREQEPGRPSTRLSTMLAGELKAAARQRQTEPPKLIQLVRGDLDWIVMKALEKNRDRRYETANGLAMDVQRHLADEPILARPPGNIYRLQKMVRRHKLVCIAAALMAAVLVVATGISVLQAFRAKRAETAARERLAESEAISKFLTEVFQSHDPARDSRTITVAEALGNAVEKLETELTNQPARVAKLEGTLGITYDALGLDYEAIPLQERVRDYYLAASGPEHPDTLTAIQNLASSYQKVGRRVEALSLQEHVLALRRKVLGPEHPDTLTTMYGLAVSYDYADRPEEALSLREKVLALRSKVLGPEDPDTLLAMQALAFSYQRASRLDEALKLREQVLALRRKVCGPEHPETIRAMLGLAISYDGAGRLDEALKLRDEALALRRKVNGPEHPDTLNAMHDVALSYAEAGRLDDALKLQEQVLALRRKVLGPEHPDTLYAMNDAALSYEEAGRLDEALKLWEQLLALRREILGPEHHETLDAMRAMAYVLYKEHKLPEAEQACREALASYAKVVATRNEEYSDTVGLLRNVLMAENKPAEVVSLYQEVLATRRLAFGPDSSTVATMLFDMANFLQSQNRPEEAAQKYREYLDIMLKPHTQENHSELSVWVIPTLLKAGERQQATNFCKVMLDSASTNATWFNNASWYLATTENPSNRDPALAVELAKRAVEINPMGDWNTVGVAYYRAGDFKQALADLEKSAGRGGSSFDWFFLAMTQHQLGHAEAAQGYYAKAVQWMKEHKAQDPELIRFRAEVVNLLGSETNAGSASQYPTLTGAK